MRSKAMIRRQGAEKEEAIEKKKKTTSEYLTEDKGS